MLEAAFFRQIPHHTPSTLLRMAVAIADCDPWRMAGQLAPRGEVPWLWQAPDGGIRLAAVGAVHHIALPAQDPLASAERWLARRRRHLWVPKGGSENVPALPWAWLASSYALPLAKQINRWGPVGGGVLVMPSFIVARTGQGACFAIHQGRLGAAGSGRALFEVAFDSLKRAMGAPSRQPMRQPHHPVPSRVSMRLGPMPSEWSRRVKMAQQKMKTGRLKKVVLAVSWTVPAHSKLSRIRLSPQQLAGRLDVAAPSTTRFLIPLAHGHFVGATPETLVSLSGGDMTTHAVAGTAWADTSRHGGGHSSFLNDPKERFEHDIVAASIVARLRAVCRNVVRAPVPEVRRFGHLLHLVTPIHATTHDPQALLKLGQRLHPTPALGGQPQSQAVGFIRQHETFWRGLYGAPVGWISPSGDGVLCVAIRSAWMTAQATTLFAGVGVVKASDPQKEWRELERKLNATYVYLNKVSR